MGKYNRILVSLCLAFVLLVTTLSIASARRYMAGDHNFIGFLRACRDGIEVTIFNTSSMAYTFGSLDPDGYLVGSTNLSRDVYVYQYPYIPDPATDFVIPANHMEESPAWDLLLPSSQLLISSLRADPLELIDSLDPNRVVEYNGHLYQVRRIFWSQQQPVGAYIALILDDIRGLWRPVEDCSFNQTPDPGKSRVVSAAQLPAPLSYLDPGALFYRVNFAPIQGELRRGSELMQGAGFFSQADVNLGLMRYTPPVLSSGNSTLDYTLRGTQSISGTAADPGIQGEMNSYDPDISADGRYVAFVSDATNLVTPDGNGIKPDIFVRDLATGQLERISESSAGVQGNDSSVKPSISGDGRYVAFASAASNLVTGDTNNTCDMDGNGSSTENCSDIFVHDRLTGVTERVSVRWDNGVLVQTNSFSRDPAISYDGRYVAFATRGSTLADDDSNGYHDIYVVDRLTDEIERISLAWNGAQGNNHTFEPAISADGNRVVFQTLASNLAPNDTNGDYDVFLVDRLSGMLSQISVSGNNSSSSPAISADGNVIAFQSRASNLVAGDQDAYCDTNNDSQMEENCSDIFIYDVSGAELELVSLPPSTALSLENYCDGVLEFMHYYGAYQPDLSDDGRLVSFYFQTDLDGACPVPAPQNAEIVVRDRLLKETSLASLSSDGLRPDDRSYNPAISADGQHVAFYSYATNLTPGDDNAKTDVYVHYLSQRGSLVLNQVMYLPLVRR